MTEVSMKAAGRAVRIGIGALALLATGPPGALPAQDPNPWVGKRVITRFGAVLRVEGRVVDNEKLENSPRGGPRNQSRIYRVEHVNGPWLWIQDEESGAAGWVTAEWLVPYDQAIDYFTREIRANPANLAAYISRGHIWIDKKEYDIALADYSEAVRLNPGNEACWVNRGRAWRAKKEYDRAIADYDEAIRLEPGYALAYFNRGLAWSAKTEYDRAIADYAEAIRLDPKDALAYFNRGNAWSAKTEYDRAIADYAEAIRLDRGYAPAYVGRGWAYYNKKEYDRAIADYAEAIRLDRGYALAYNNRGGAWRAKKEYDRAIADYAEAIRIDPRDADAHYNRSVARMITRRGDAAEGFKTVLDLEKGKGDLSTYAVILGHLAARQAGNETEAGRFLEDAKKLDASAWPFPAVKFLRGELDEAGFLALAVDDDKKTEGNCFVGLDHVLKGRKDEALAHLRWVRDHGTSASAEYAIALAELDRLGDPSVARTTPAPTPPAPGPVEPSAGPAKLEGTDLYVPIPQIEARFGTDPRPMADYIGALKARTLAILDQAEPTRAKGLLVAVGLKSGKRSKVWCQAVGGEIPAALLRTLERELGEVEAVELKASPAGFALKFRLQEGGPIDFPTIPDRWKDASLSTRSKMAIPPDDLFRILWPD